jgi:hypothetical protein
MGRSAKESGRALGQRRDVESGLALSRKLMRQIMRRFIGSVKEYVGTAHRLSKNPHSTHQGPKKAKQKRKLVIRPVGVEKVRDRNVFSAAMIAAAEFFLLTSAKKRLP